MSDTQDDSIDGSIGQIEGQMLIRRANKQALLSVPVPTWPERASFLLSLLFVCFVVYAPRDSATTGSLVMGTFIATMSCHWYFTAKLRKKIEVLSEIACDSASRT